MLQFAVKDTGIGIPIEKQQRIFEAFSQADGSMARKYGGTGLGLTICSKLVGMMNGQIWVESEPRQGSIFHFTVRVGVQSGGIDPAAAPASASLHGVPVLIVDDNGTSRRVLGEMLTRWGMRPLAVGGGQQALERVESAKRAGDPFALLLLDAQMPDMDGFAVARELQKEPRLVQAGIMMLTSAGRVGDAARCRELGISAYLVKPISQSELLNSILTVLKKAPRKDGAALVTRHTLHERSSRARVLLVEDNAINRTLALRILEKRGYTVSVAEDGQAALAALEEGRFDIVLMDVQMPGMDGFEATAAIREKEKLTREHIPIIATTAHALKGDQERCLSAGMDGYISKPIRAADLLSAIETFLPGLPGAVATEAVQEDPA